jgi:hypothetical protein
MCQPRKQADCTSVGFVTGIDAGTTDAFVASATLDLRGATPTSTWCITATAPFAVYSSPGDGISYLAAYTLTLYRCPANADNAYPATRFVSESTIRGTFYRGNNLPVTAQVVATVPPDVYTAVLTTAAAEPLNIAASAEGRINISASGQVLRYW